MNDNSQQTANEKSQASTHQRTSTTSSKSQDTSKAQYDRLTGSGRKVVPTGAQVGKGTI